MLEVGYSEILVIAIVLIVVVGPKDLPKMLRAFGKAMTRFRQVSGDFRRQFDDALKEAELDEVRKTIDDVRKLDPRQQVRDVFNPLRSVADGIRNDVQSAVRPVMQSNPAGAAKADAVAVAPVVASAVNVETTRPQAAKSKTTAAKKTTATKTASPKATKPVTKPVALAGAKASVKSAAKTVAQTPAKSVAKSVAAAPAKSPAKPLAKSASKAEAKPAAAKRAKA